MLFRDAYNRTNLRLASDLWPNGWELSFWAANEPWDGPGVGFLVRLAGRWLKFEVWWR